MLTEPPLARLADFVRAAPKVLGRGVHRVQSPSRTCRRVEPVARRIGVTRLADITGLDRLRIPTFSAVRPAADLAGVSITCGKGTTRPQAKAGALMEAIEYASAEPGDFPVLSATFEELSRRSPALDPRDLVLPVWSPYRPDRALEWVEALDLATGGSCWLPANAAFHPYVPEGEPLLILRPSSNGLAAGNTIEEAICHALAEVIERDSWALCWVRVRYGEGDRFPGLDIDLASLDPDLALLLARFEESRIELFLRDISSEMGVPAYYAGTLERVGERFLAHEGMGAHPDPEVALSRALTEAAQSRAADIQGSREDLGYWRRRAGDWYDRPEAWSVSEPAFRVPFPGGRGARFADVKDDIAWMVERLASQGLGRVLVVDLTREAIGIPVVRVVVPGLEFVATDEYRVGARAHRAAEEAQRAVQGGAP